MSRDEEIRSPERGKPGERVIIGNAGYVVAAEQLKVGQPVCGSVPNRVSNSISTRDEAFSGPATAATE